MKGFLYRLIPPRADFGLTMMSEDGRATMTAHAAYWTELAVTGTVLAFGPIADPNGTHGLGVVLAEDLEAAEALRDADPAVLSRHGFRIEVIPFLSPVSQSRHAERTLRLTSFT